MTKIDGKIVIGAAICNACKHIGRIWKVWKTSRCQDCNQGGKFFQHYALAVVAAGTIEHYKSDEQLHNRVARLDKESILLRRDLTQHTDSNHAHVDSGKLPSRQFSRLKRFVLMESALANNSRHFTMRKRRRTIATV